MGKIFNYTHSGTILCLIKTDKALSLSIGIGLLFKLFVKNSLYFFLHSYKAYIIDQTNLKGQNTK